VANDELLLKDFLQETDEEIAEIIKTIGGLSIPILDEIPHRRGEAGSQNVYGEQQKALDVWVNDLLTEHLLDIDCVSKVLSEEVGEPVEAEKCTGSYSVTLDPLDGSSNIKSNNLFGTIVGIYDTDDVPTKGREQVAALYKLYGPMTTLVITLGDGVHEFAKARKGHNKYFMINEDIKLPEDPKIYGVGGNPKKWVPEFSYFVDMLRDQGLKNRYGGSFVGDFTQVLKYGGFFGYPALMDRPTGKLRLIFEGNPISFITEQAGGKGSTGAANILDISPREIDERIPIYVGNQELVEELEDLFKVCKEAREEY